MPDFENDPTPSTQPSLLPPEGTEFDELQNGTQVANDGQGGYHFVEEDGNVDQT